MEVIAIKLTYLGAFPSLRCCRDDIAANPRQPLVVKFASNGSVAFRRTLSGVSPGRPLMPFRHINFCRACSRWRSHTFLPMA
jgi:hypothetical protein